MCYGSRVSFLHWDYPSPCSLGLSATSQQYSSLRTNQPPATSQNQPAVLFSQNKPAPAISHQPTEQAAYLFTFDGIGFKAGIINVILPNNVMF
jgi:hypothetical protein